MICHVCEKQAVGQCQRCGKFYCGQHGDGVCAGCSENVQASPAAMTRALIPLRDGSMRRGNPGRR